LTGPIEGTAAWHTVTTENPKEGDCEEWEIWNVSADAHPVHLHLVHFEVVSRHEISANGIFVTEQPIVQHNGKLGTGKKIVYPSGCLPPNSPSSCYNSTAIAQEPRYVETGPLDVVTALPNQVTKIRVLFDKPGRYVWHCHLLSHEDHEMMRVLQVGPE
jgi:FtsP/CotA-like multicopper oxidase with cupredoxin domain